MGAADHISALGSVSFGWLHEQGGFTFEEPFFLDPQVRLAQERRMHAFVEARFAGEPIYNLEAHLVQIQGRRKPVALVGGLQPNLILAAAVGSQFLFPGDKDPDVTTTPLAEGCDLDRLWNIDWAKTWPISLFLDQIFTLRETLDPQFTIVPPYFWDTTGRATTHGLVTTAQKLLGERIFLEMTDNPAFVHEFFRWIVDAYAQQIELLAEAAGMKVVGLHTGDCSVCMIGPDQFAEFVLAPLNEFAQRVGPLRLHSCGPSDHLLELFGQVRHLASLNVGSGTSVARIRERFGPIPIDLIPETQLLTVGTPARVDAWVRQCVAENGDGQLQFECHLDLGQPEANCLQIPRTLESLGCATGRVEIH